MEKVGLPGLIIIDSIAGFPFTHRKTLTSAGESLLVPSMIIYWMKSQTGMNY